MPDDTPKPIETARELVRALLEVQKRTTERSRVWYLLNKFQREAMAAADEEEASFACRLVAKTLRVEACDRARKGKI